MSTEGEVSDFEVIEAIYPETKVDHARKTLTITGRSRLGNNEAVIIRQKGEPR